jgi:hypothetical protein
MLAGIAAKTVKYISEIRGMYSIRLGVEDRIEEAAALAGKIKHPS